MGWATALIERLQKGETVQFRPTGNSMTPIIRSKQLCTVAPVDPLLVEVHDVVLCRVRGSEYLHLVKSKRVEKNESGTKVSFLICNNKGHDNGWTHQVFGRLIKVDD